MLRRTSSFKRRVKSGQSTSAAADASAPAEHSKILIRGEARVSHQAGSKGMKFLSGYVVAYAGANGGLCIALYKNQKDFTPFRAFPEDVTYLTSSRCVEEAQTAGLPGYCISLEGDGSLAQPPLFLSFASREERSAWMRVLQPAAKAAVPDPTPSLSAEEAATRALDAGVSRISDWVSAQCGSNPRVAGRWIDRVLRSIPRIDRSSSLRGGGCRARVRMRRPSATRRRACCARPSKCESCTRPLSSGCRTSCGKPMTAWANAWRRPPPRRSKRGLLGFDGRTVGLVTPPADHRVLEPQSACRAFFNVWPRAPVRPTLANPTLLKVTREARAPLSLSQTHKRVY
jgi:hypothetical protein